MKTYLVGGAVRDKLLGLPVVDRDWVVVGETPDTMLNAGYTSVGKDFPVFLHPTSHEEYALARTERKTGPGYHGFQFDTDKSVTLEEDLLRRDLTINAIAEDHDGKLIDPFNGQQDIKDGVLRHVSPAFAEDPVRVLRIAKFMARFSHLGFDVAASTLSMIHGMVSSGEIDNLVPERVWQEFQASLNAKTPRAFFTTLQRANALAPVMIELDQALQRVPMLNALDAACELSDDARIRFAALCAGFTPTYASSLDSFCQRLRVPSAFSELALLCARFATQTHRAFELDAAQLHALLKSLDASRRPERFNNFLIAAHAHANAQAKANRQVSANELTESHTIARTDTTAGAEKTPTTDYLQAAHVQACALAMGSIDAATIAKSEPNKSNISTVIKQHEVAAIEAYLTRP